MITEKLLRENEVCLRKYFAICLTTTKLNFRFDVGRSFAIVEQVHYQRR